MNRRKKIIFVLRKLMGGGAEKNAVLIMEKLDREKFEPMLVLFEDGGRFRDSVPGDIEVKILGKTNKMDFFKLIFGLSKIITDMKPDIVFSSLDYPNIITVFAGIISRWKAKIIISEHNDPEIYVPLSNLSVLRRIFMKLTYSRSDKIIAVSKGVRDALNRYLQIEENMIEVIYNPVDINNVKYQADQCLSDIPDKLKNKFTIISAGRLTEQKNHKLLLNVFKNVISEIDAALLILGSGDMESELKEESVSLGISEAVYFAGFIDNPYNWIRYADVFVLSSSWEGFGNVIIEAMACETPVISTDCPVGPNEIIINGSNGILTDVKSISSMTRAIIRIYNDKDLAGKLVSNANDSVKEYDLTSIIKKYENCFLCGS